MTPNADELRRLWESESGERKIDESSVIRQVEKRARDFDRTIRFRDMRETGAGLLVAALFLWMAIHDRTPLQRAAHLWLAMCGVWIAYYLRRYARISHKPAPEQTLLAYRQGLLDRYDRQIRLLKSAKYWYILPFWTGLMLSAYAYLDRTGDALRFCVMVGFMTLLNGGLWWLNEVAGVRWLRNRQRRVSQ
jgi:hypothetical protein